VPRALLSVYDKRGLVTLARALSDGGHELIASGGTARALSRAGLAVTPVAALTGQAEMLGGRVKTLHPAIHAGILAQDCAADRAQRAQAGVAPIDMVVCNLYPFQQASARAGTTLAEAVEQIDIGGVALLRAAAKNFARVITLCDPDYYDRIAEQLRSGQGVALATRRALAAKVFALTQAYDAAIHARLLPAAPAASAASEAPARLTQTLHRAEVLRYGENPHQPAAWYSLTLGAGPLGGELLGGQKPLSYNNYLDLDAAWRSVHSRLAARLAEAGAALAAADPRAILQRGYVILTQAQDGARVTSVHEAGVGDGLLAQLRDGVLPLRVEDRETHERYRRTLF